MLFTIFLWVFMILIYYSSRNNKINQWCAITIFIFSFGTFKEFLYYDLPEMDILHNGTSLGVGISENVYSIMTAVLYNWVMPSCIIFALYFSRFLVHKDIMFRWIKLLVFIPSIVLFLVYPPYNTSLYQHTSITFWYVISIYNVLYGIVISFIMILSVSVTQSPFHKRQKRFLCMIVLPPLWFWLITIFVIHSLQIEALYKVWKDNIYVLVISIICYMILAFREGIMGLILRTEHFHWNAEMKIAAKSSHYLNHVLKNELVKIEWSLHSLTDKHSLNESEEVNIIMRSTDHLKQFVDRTQLYSNEIVLNCQKVSLTDMLTTAVSAYKNTYQGKIKIQYHEPEELIINCDPKHLSEVINNILSNAVEAMGGQGTIYVTVKDGLKNNMYTIIIRDEGCGIPRKNINKLFDPYFSTKNSNWNFGLGLSYCYNVIKKHKGFIDIKSEEGKGSTFFLYLPNNLKR